MGIGSGFPFQRQSHQSLQMLVIPFKRSDHNIPSKGVISTHLKRSDHNTPSQSHSTPLKKLSATPLKKTLNTPSKGNLTTPLKQTHLSQTNTPFLPKLTLWQREQPSSQQHAACAPRTSEASCWRTCRTGQRSPPSTWEREKDRRESPCARSRRCPPACRP